jgi:hypothetical protein
MYPIFLATHNIIRWVALILTILAVVRAYLGWFGKREWTQRDRKIGSYTAMAFDIQLLLGLILYFVYSPLVRTALQDFGAAMQVADLRFFALEHAIFMVLAVVFAHLGSILPRKAEGSAGKHKRAAIAFSLALLMVLLGMPWLRPLLPGLG